MDFSIRSTIIKADYVKVMYIGLYKKPFYIFATILGIGLLIVSALIYFDDTGSGLFSPFIDVIFGLFLILSPSLIVLLSLGQLKSNPSFLNEMIYNFNDLGMSVTGSTFKTELKWEHIIKLKEIGDFLVLYHTKKFGNFIYKSKLTPEQLSFIKSKIIKK